MSRSTLCLKIQLHASLGLGWEDIYAILMRDGLIQQKDKQKLRKYVLRLSSFTERYGT